MPFAGRLMHGVNPLFTALFYQGLRPNTRPDWATARCWAIGGQTGDYSA